MTINDIAMQLNVFMKSTAFIGNDMFICTYPRGKFLEILSWFIVSYLYVRY